MLDATATDATQQFLLYLPTLLPFVFLGVFGGIAAFILKADFSFRQLFCTLFLAVFASVILGIYLTGKDYEQYLIYVSCAAASLASEPLLRLLQRFTVKWTAAKIDEEAEKLADSKTTTQHSTGSSSEEKQQ